jgi:hypothetical protein
VGGRLLRLHRPRYFVLHDTSHPSYGAAPFPPDLDAPSWSGNDLRRWSRRPRAHLFVSRTGSSLTAVDFRRPWRATKRERQSPALRGRCVHVELVQPRRSDPSGPPGNDALAPDPPFTGAQLERLAVAYVVASVRAGRWLVPAFHAALDAGLRGAHDDPQGFDLERWLAHVRGVAASVRRSRAGPDSARTP